MREIVSTQIGQCGNQIGHQFWKTLLQEHEPTISDAASTFFYQTPNTTQIQARALLVDMEEGVLNVIRRSELSPLFQDYQFVSGTDGSGNNFGDGYKRHGDERKGEFLEKLNKILEKCDSPQAIFTFSSLGGGTGSGLGARLIEEIKSEIHLQIVSACVIPSKDAADVITAPYNAVCSMASLLSSSDIILPFDNDKIFNAIAQAKPAAPQATSQIKCKQASLYDIFASKNKQQQENTVSAKSKAFTEANQLIANSLSAVTASMRFGGEMNVDLNEVSTNLIPYRELNLSMVNISPIRGDNTISQKLKQLFTKQNNLSSYADDELTLANIIFSRSKELDLGLFSQCFEQVIKNDSFLQNNSFKIGITSGGVDNKEDFCWIRNGSSCRHLLNYIQNSYMQLKSKRMYLHHYLKFIEEDDLDQRYEVLKQVESGYESLESRLNGEQVAIEEETIRGKLRAALI